MEYQNLLICGFSSSSFIFVFLGGLSISIDDEDVRILYIFIFLICSLYYDRANFAPSILHILQYRGSLVSASIFMNFI